MYPQHHIYIYIYVRWFAFSLWNISSLCYNWSISPHLWCLNSHLFILSTFSRVSPLLTAYTDTALTIPRVSRFWWEAIALSDHPVAPGTAVPPPSSHTPSRMPEAKASMRGRSARSPWRKGSVRDRPWQERWWKKKCENWNVKWYQIKFNINWFDQTETGIWHLTGKEMGWPKNERPKDPKVTNMLDDNSGSPILGAKTSAATLLGLSDQIDAATPGNIHEIHEYPLIFLIYQWEYDYCTHMAMSQNPGT